MSARGILLDLCAPTGLNHASKVDIARECAKHITNDSSVFLNIGTTTEAVAAELTNHKGLLVVTNNLNVAQTLAANPNCETVVTGGRLRAADGGLVGADAATAIARFKLDIAIVGCSAIDGDGDLLDFDPDEVTVSRAILDQARQVFLVADASKFKRLAPARIGNLAQVDRLFTDAPLPAALADLCARHGIDVRITAA